MIFIAGLDVVGVQVGHLGLGDLPKLVARDLGDLGAVRGRRAGVDAGGLLEQHGGRRRLEDEVDACGPRRP